MNLLDLLVSLQVLNFVRMEFSWFRFHFSFRFFSFLVFPRCQRCFGVSITTFSFTTALFSPIPKPHVLDEEITLKFPNWNNVETSVVCCVVPTSKGEGKEGLVQVGETKIEENGGEKQILSCPLKVLNKDKTEQMQ